MEVIYDCVIVGGGPCGVSSALYLKRAGKNIVVVEKYALGGQVLLTNKISNYAGFLDVSGEDLANNMEKQLSSLNVPIIYDEVISLDFSDKIKKVITKKLTLNTKSIILSLGAENRKLDIQGEKELLGKGVSYCATCDGNFYKGMDVAVIGGGNSAFQDAIYLSSLAKKVYLIHRREFFRAEDYLVKEVQNLVTSNKVELLLNENVLQINGKDFVENITLKNAKDDSLKTIEVQGVFIAVGRAPHTDFIKGINFEDGYILVDDKFRTNVEGVFAGGDVIKKSLRQISTAVSDGAILSVSVMEYLKQFSA
jgi:thioredoxin reductase (NADPH)